MDPTGTEHFYVRMLLHYVVAPTSFEDPKRHNGVEHNTFKEFCVDMGLLDDNTEWDACMHEATSSTMPHQIRSLFATILVFGQPLEPLCLLQKFISDMSKNWSHLNKQTRMCKCISAIDEQLRQFNKSITDLCTLASLSQEFGYSEND